ncbi:restriction endonuclease subunit S [Seonamhaeicola sp. NFXS20]|uniref:restriction endonuclease subunit S n=1 Tax=Seonamhaeicola sp. NFXS20 TaxID=2816959 RepID=UPI003B8B2D35
MEVITETKAGFQKTKFGIAPIDWPIKKLGDVCVNFKSGNSITSESISSIGKYPVYGGNGLRGYSSEFTHEGDYFLIGRQGALCGNIVRITGKNFVSEHAIAVQTDTENDLDFLSYRLEHLKLNRLSESSAQPGLSVKRLIGLKLAFPPLPEQQKIAEILSTWDRAIEKTQNLIQQLQLRKKGLMQQLLTGRKRLSGFDGGVTLTKLKGLLKEKSDRNKSLGVKRVLSVTNSRGFINQSEQFDRKVASKDLSNYKIVRKGQFAYNPSRVNVGSIDLLRNFDEGLLSPMYIIFETDDRILNPDFLYYQLKTWWFIGHIPQFVQGSVRDSLSFDGLESMSFYIPSLEEQKAIASVIETADQEISLQQEYLEQLQSQKKGLMQQLLTGKIRVKL